MNEIPIRARCSGLCAVHCHGNDRAGRYAGWYRPPTGDDPGLAFPPETADPGLRAVDNAQKRDILERLYTVWTANPQLRLMQLIGNVLYYRTDPYYTEDYDAITEIERFYTR